MPKPKSSPLRLVRIVLALASLTLLTPAFLGVAGGGWLVHLQFLPALLALNVVVVVALLLATWLFGRVYCSIICPLGIMQDVFTRLGSIGKKKRKWRFGYRPAKNWLRHTVLAFFIAAMAAGIGSVVALLAPYSAFGRIVANLVAPLWAWGNNACAALAESQGSYAFSETEVWVRSWPVFGIAAATLLALAVLAWRHGRAYCNTICPVGTLLGLVSRVSLSGIRIDTQKCIACGLCAKQCKAKCIDPKEHAVDASRCVACMDCLGACSVGAISYGLRKGAKAAEKAAEAKPAPKAADPARRHFLLGTGFVLATAAAPVKEEKSVDGGFATLLDKKAPARRHRILPPGAQGYSHFERHCTGCQLCVSACPNGVLRPSGDWKTLMQPESSYERGFCRPGCTKCSHACPAGALLPVSRAEKSSIQIGHAVFVKELCVAVRDGVSCGNCARHCPVGAITMVKVNPDAPDSPEIPVVDESRCIGCGACENLCPARPHSAIYVEGHEQHKTL